METLKSTTKAAVAEQLRSFAANPIADYAIAAIHGLGELGGQGAVDHIEALMDESSGNVGPAERAKWVALLQAYGRAARFLPE